MRCFIVLVTMLCMGGGAVAQDLGNRATTDPLSTKTDAHIEFRENDISNYCSVQLMMSLPSCGN